MGGGGKLNPKNVIPQSNLTTNALNCQGNSSFGFRITGLKPVRISAFTLAEILITLAIIGIVAALTIPSVISNAQQQEYKTGLKKAVSVLNQAIATNLALDGDTPYTTKDDLLDFLSRHMSVIKKVDATTLKKTEDGEANSNTNNAFYTTDGMRFEAKTWGSKNSLYRGFTFYDPPESEKDAKFHDSATCGAEGSAWKCGSYGLATNPNNTKCAPCIVLVDVNGDKKPSKLAENATDVENSYVWAKPDDGYLTDIFNLMITESRVIPYGTVAQKAMYEER